MGANIPLLTGRQHLHLHPDCNHHQGRSRTLQRLRVSTGVCTLSFAQDACNLLTLCTARADSWIATPTARVVACRWRGDMARNNVLTRSFTFSNPEHWRLCDATEDVETPAKYRSLHGGVREDSQAFLQAPVSRQNDSTMQGMLLRRPDRTSNC